MGKPALLEKFAALQNFNSEIEKEFILNLETNISQDLWQSAGGHWSEKSIELFCQKSMSELAQKLPKDSATQTDLQNAWNQVVRDFHQNNWGEQRLAKKEKKELTQDQKISRELFAYIFILLQTTFVTKTIVLYFGIASSDSDDPNLKIWVTLAALFTLFNLSFFAYRKFKSK